MKLSEIARTLSPTAWVVGAAGTSILLLVVWWVFIGGPAHDRQRAAEAVAASTFAKGRADAAADAAEAVGANAAADAETNQIQRENSDEIDKAPDAGTAVPATAGALRAGLCRYEAYRAAPECLQRARPR